MSDELFLRNVETYKREINPVKQYIDQTGFYLSKMTGKDIQECKNFIISGIKDKKISFDNPVVNFFHRNEYGDRHKDAIRLSGYIDEINKNEELLAPTFTTYYSPKFKQSLLTGFIDENKKLRSKSKKEEFEAKANGNTALAVFKNNEQTNFKLRNNSVSGGFATGNSIFNNPSSHSTLTSTTRTVSSIGNSSNEKLIAGNRHYRSVEITLNNIIAISYYLNKEEIKSIIDKYSLSYPSVDETMECIKRSTDLYWQNTKALNEIREFVEKLDDIERAGFVYIGDFYHIRKYNENFVKNLLTKMHLKITDKIYDDPIKIIKQTNEAIVNLVHHICYSEVIGKGKKYEELSLEYQNHIAGTCENVTNIIKEYKDFFNTFFLTDIMPVSSAYVPNIVRRSVVLSDTDSTMFSIDEWVIWYLGDLIFNDEAMALAASVMFITTQCIAHQLALLSANMGIEKSKVFDLAMKPEYTFPVFAQTSVAKHYYTYKTVQEGSVFKEKEPEIKGVHLKNSALPKNLVKQAQDRMMRILDDISNNKKISILEHLKEVADTERNIIKSLLNSEITYLRQTITKLPEAYALPPDKSPYNRHQMWIDVFEESYGSISNPPYRVVKIPTILDNPTKMKDWLDSLPDQKLAERMKLFLVKYNKKFLPTLYLNVTYVLSNGIPEDIKKIIDVHSIVKDITRADVLILESLGYFIKPGFMVSDLGY